MIHILTPTYRWQNLAYLRSNLEKFSRGIPLQWHWLLSEQDADEWKPLFSNLPDWIHPFNCKGMPHGDICYSKCNQWLSSTELGDEDWYGVIADDNMVGETVFSKLQSTPKDKQVAIFSSLRGHRRIDHDISTLYALPEHIGVCRTDLGQYYLRGSVFKKHRFNHLSGVADGDLIQRVHKIYPTAYYPNDFVYFNILQIGRWKVGEISFLFV